MTYADWVEHKSYVENTRGRRVSVTHTEPSGEQFSSRKKASNVRNSKIEQVVLDYCAARLPSERRETLEGLSHREMQHFLRKMRLLGRRVTELP